MPSAPHRIWPLVALCAGLTTIPAPAGADTAFVRALLEKDRATVADACRLVAVLHTKDRGDATFEQDLATLREAEIVSKKWTWTKDQPITCGEMGYMLCKTLGIKGGLTTRMFGMSKRYAFRECAFRKLLPPAHESRHLTGKELIAAAALAEQHMRQTQARAK